MIPSRRVHAGLCRIMRAIQHAAETFCEGRRIQSLRAFRRPLLDDWMSRCSHEGLGIENRNCVLGIGDWALGIRGRKLGKITENR